MMIKSLCILALSGLTYLHGAPEAFEIGPRQLDALPRGKEADGILGDFVIRNDKVEALIAHNAPNRRANMSTFYGEDGTSSGCLYDLTLRGTANDQMTIFAPLDQRGAVSYVRVVDSGESGQALIETKVSSAINKGVEITHHYHIADGWLGLLIVSTVRNDTNQAHKFQMDDTWKSFLSEGRYQGIDWADAVDPADKVGYATMWSGDEDAELPAGGEVSLKPGESIKLARFLAVGDSPAQAVGLIAARAGETGRLVRRIVNENGEPVTSGTLELVYKSGDSEKVLPAYPNADGDIDILLPANQECLFRLVDHGRLTQSFKVTVGAGATDEATVKVLPASRIRFRIRDEAGMSLPCKVQFHGRDGTASPNLGPNNRAHGCIDQYHSETGDFTVPLDAGSYQIIVTRGIEFSHLKEMIRLEQGKEATVEGTLKRLVQTPGWVSADFHNHSTPSGDNTCGTDDRMINLAAEHIEFAPTTEHNRIYDWRPHLERLKLTDYIQTVGGVELTGSGAHFNAFPYEANPHAQDGGAPVWQKDPRLNAIMLRDLQGQNPDRWVQINHPDQQACAIHQKVQRLILTLFDISTTSC